MSKFYKCPMCGNIIGKIHDSGVPVVCCGKPMEHLEANTVEASYEKHIPDVKIEDGIVKVQVGSVAHPMAEEHFIEWVSLQTKFGNQRKVLNHTDEPKAVFAICEGDEVVAVYAYCNLHSLWKA